MQKTFVFRVDPPDMSSVDPLVGLDYFAGGGDKVHFKLLEGFTVAPMLMPQMRVGIGDIEKTKVWVDFDFELRQGCYTVAGGPSRLSVGQVVSATIRTQLNPAASCEAILQQLRRDPEGLMIEILGKVGWIAPDSRASGDSINIGGHDETSEFITSLCLVAELLREGELELDGEGVVKLKGHAVVPSTGSWFDDGIVGEDLSIEECINRIDAWGRGQNYPRKLPTHWTVRRWLASLFD